MHPEKKAFLCLSLIFFFFCGSSTGTNCWKDAYGRGAGVPIHQCPKDTVQSGLLCYPPCKPGYEGDGPVCWEVCPAGFNDTGADCLKPPAYGRGAGYASEDDCLRENPSGCEKNGDLWYPLCKPGYHAVGCCVCSPDCPSGFVDIGVSCQKDSYGRGAGVPLGCGNDEEESGALCYPICDEGFEGNGPVCWALCPQGKFSCSALCTETADGCSETVKNVVEDVVAAAVTVAEAAAGQVDIAQIIAKIGKIATDLAQGICQKPSFMEILRNLRKYIRI